LILNYLVGSLLTQCSQTAGLIIIIIIFYCVLYCYRIPDEIRKIETGIGLVFYCVKLLCFILLDGFLACVFYRNAINSSEEPV